MILKKLLFLHFFTFLLFASVTAQEKYFHELRGMEDSSGVTHLFYRMYESQSTTCSDMDGYTSEVKKVTDPVYHFDTSTSADSVEFSSGNSISPGCFAEWRNTEKYIFTADHPDSSFIIES